MGDVTSQRSLKRRTNFCSPSIEKCANFLRTHSWISFAKVSVGGIRVSKASFFEWSDTTGEKQYLSLPRQQLYVCQQRSKLFEISLISKSLPSHYVEIIPCCQQQHCFSASSRQLLWCFFFSFYNFIDSSAFQNQMPVMSSRMYFLLDSVHWMNHPCIEYCSCRSEVWSRTCYLWALRIWCWLRMSLSLSQLLYVVQ